jgi:uncharacterized membrane protein YphA (DoxX/SURF4 family)
MGVLADINRTRAPAATLLIRWLAAGLLLFRSMTAFTAAPTAEAGSSVVFFGAGLELILALLLFLGAFTRAAAVLAFIDAAIAVFFISPVPPGLNFARAVNEFRGEYSLALSSLFLVIVGAGPISIDRWIAGPPPSRRERGSVVRPPGAWTERQYEKSKQRE